MKGAMVWVLENMSLVTLLLALVLGSLAAKRKGPSAGGGWEPTVFWLLLLFVGGGGLYAGFSHLFDPARVAAEIGWRRSPFQWDVGVADVMIGMLGVVGAFMSRSFRWAVVLAFTVWYWGDAVGHVRQVESVRNFAPGHAGTWFWVDVLGPFLLLFAQASNRSDRK